MKNFKWTYFFLFILLWIPYSCSRDTNVSEIQINIDQDTVNMDEPFTANLVLDNYKNELPEFFIVGQNDTFRLVFIDSIKSAYFSAISHKSGNKTYNGFAQYVDSTGRFKKENFKINVVVR